MWSLFRSLDPSQIGAAAGLGASVSWAVTSVLFTAAGRRLGSTTVNASRLIIAFAVLTLAHALITGSWIPAVSGPQLLALAASGLIGLAICDQALFTAFVDVGPRRALLIMTTSPLWAVGFGWAFLGETPTPLRGLGVILIVAGVATVVLERRPTGGDTARHPHALRGAVLAAAAAALQAVGLLLSKQGITAHDDSPAVGELGATLVRMVFGVLGVAPILLVAWMRRHSRSSGEARGRRVGSRPIGLALAATGAVTGPILGVWLQLVSVNAVSVGVAQALSSLAPVLILPVTVLVLRERVPLLGWAGAALAVGGSALLFLT